MSLSLESVGKNCCISKIVDTVHCHVHQAGQNTFADHRCVQFIVCNLHPAGLARFCVHYKIDWLSLSWVVDFLCFHTCEVMIQEMIDWS
jgi:hypothetical protein